MSQQLLARTYQALDDLELRPIIDPALMIVRGDCPACHAGDLDPYGIHRPLAVSCHTRNPRVWCTSGCGEPKIAAALQAARLSRELGVCSYCNPQTAVRHLQVVA